MSKSTISSKESGRDVEKERELKFKYWLQTKALKEKAFEVQYTSFSIIFLTFTII